MNAYTKFYDFGDAKMIATNGMMPNFYLNAQHARASCVLTSRLRLMQAENL